MNGLMDDTEPRVKDENVDVPLSDYEEIQIILIIIWENYKERRTRQSASTTVLRIVKIMVFVGSPLNLHLGNCNNK